MTTRRLLSFVSPLTFAALAAVACSSSDDAKKAPDPGGKFTFQEDGLYRYIYGVDVETGRFITGGAHEVVVASDRDGKFEKIDNANDPGRLHPTLSKTDYKKYDATVSKGESDWQVFASNWWAQSNNGIAKRWTGGSQDYNDISDTDNLSPTEKYDLLYHPGQQKQVATVKHWNYRELLKKEEERGEKHEHTAVTVAGPATKWELENHGTYQDYAHPDSWWGHCNGWASYATTEKNGIPARDIRVKLGTDGKVQECIGDTSGCILFRMGDIEAMFSEIYFSDKATFSGRRCNTDPDKIERDEYGRPKDPACRDLNPGSFHIGVTGLLGKGAEHLKTKVMGKPAFIIDHNWDWEVWNFPLTKFEILEATEVTKEDAAKLVGAQEYVFNDQARKFMKIKMKYWMVSDGVNDAKMKLHALARGIQPHETELNYVLELSDAGIILGGEWIDDPSTSWSDDGKSKNLHPDFYWMAADVVGSGEDSNDKGGSNDNPYIGYKELRALLDCSNDPTTCAPPAPPPPDGGTGTDGGTSADGGTSTGGPNSCVNNCGKQASGGCWCDDQCAQYGDCCADKDAACTGGGTPPPPPDPNSCKDSCGKKAPGGCWCDATCENYGDCCADKKTTCG